MSIIRLRSGRVFDFANPDKTPLDIGDIAFGLAREIRYSNQSVHPYTVAQHSVHCAHSPAVPEKWQLSVLLHDASEAVMRDIASPLKALLPDYQRLEEIVQNSIYRSFEVKPPPEDLIRKVDAAARVEEMEYVFDPNQGAFSIWSDSIAYKKFLQSFLEFSNIPQARCPGSGAIIPG